MRHESSGETAHHRLLMLDTTRRAIMVNSFRDEPDRLLARADTVFTGGHHRDGDRETDAAA